MAKGEVDEAMKELKAKLEEKAESKPAAQPDEDQRKLFVGGLAQDAKDTDIKEYFGQYGEIEHINLKHDPMTGRSRGFAFIVFKETSGLEAASAQEAHVIKDKRCTCKKAECRQGKIYVGKLPADQLTNDELTAHFAQFGSVVEVIRPVDKLRGDAPKNFCFVTFEREEPARKLVKEGFTIIKGHQVVVSRVTPKDASRGGFMGRGRGNGGGFGMGYGSYAGGFGGSFSPYGGFGEPFAGAYAYGGGYGSPAPGGFGANQGYYTAESVMGGYYAGRPSPGKVLRGAPPMRGRGPRGRPY